MMLRILAKQALAIREQADAMLSIIGLLMKDEFKKEDEEEVVLPKVFGGRAGEPDKKEEK